MLSLIIFTYKRLKKLHYCLESIDSTLIKEILIFNDDENQLLTTSMLHINPMIKQWIKIYNPQDFGYNNRLFRKPIYLNKAVELAKSEMILFTDDDGVFYKKTIDKHIKSLQNNVFCAGSIIKKSLINKYSKSILQGTNYSFQKQFFYKIGGYDEAFANSNGSGDVDFWYRIYTMVKAKKYPVAFLENAKQKVSMKSIRKKNHPKMNARDYTLKKHDFKFKGPMYKWFPEIRNKSSWMKIIN